MEHIEFDSHCDLSQSYLNVRHVLPLGGRCPCCMSAVGSCF
jgi:hypothetical protein